MALTEEKGKRDGAASACGKKGFGPKGTVTSSPWLGQRRRKNKSKEDPFLLNPPSCPCVWSEGIDRQTNIPKAYWLKKDFPFHLAMFKYSMLESEYYFWGFLIFVWILVSGEPPWIFSYSNGEEGWQRQRGSPRLPRWWWWWKSTGGKSS